MSTGFLLSRVDDSLSVACLPDDPGERNIRNGYISFN